MLPDRGEELPFRFRKEPCHREAVRRGRLAYLCTNRLRPRVLEVVLAAGSAVAVNMAA